MRCHTPFTLTNRKHHCRNCGNVFCGDCSSKSIPLPHLGIAQPVRVCETCFEERGLSKSPKSPSVNQNSSATVKAAQNKLMQPRNARVEDDDDKDLRLALQMSLEEAKRVGNVSANGVANQTVKEPSGSMGKTANVDDPEDVDLKAAIAASLRDLEEKKANENPTIHSYDHSQPTSYTAGSAAGSHVVMYPVDSVLIYHRDLTTSYPQ